MDSARRRARGAALVAEPSAFGSELTVVVLDRSKEPLYAVPMVEGVGGALSSEAPDREPAVVAVERVRASVRKQPVPVMLRSAGMVQVQLAGV